MIKSKFFDNVSYSAADWANFFSPIYSDGIIATLEPEQTEVTAFKVIKSTGMTLLIGDGNIFIRGYQATSQNTSVVVPMTQTSPRIDRVVVKLDMETSPQGFSIYIKQGTADTPPSLTRTETIYEMSLATINIPANSATLADAEITDDRGNPNFCGVSKFYGSNSHPTMLPDTGSFSEVAFGITTPNTINYIEIVFPRKYNTINLLITSMNYFGNKFDLTLYSNTDRLKGIMLIADISNQTFYGHEETDIINEPDMKNIELHVTYSRMFFSSAYKQFITSFELIQDDISNTTKLRIGGKSEPFSSAQGEIDFKINIDYFAWE